MPPTPRLDEDLTRQKNAVLDARMALSDALDALAKVSRRQSSARTPDLEAVTAAHNAVLRAGEARDIAELDLATAAGADA